MKRLLFSAAVIAVSALQAQDCSELFFSEYVEGSSQNKALEIYNPTTSSIDLSEYKIKRYKNGQSLPDTELQLSGMLAGHDVVVISNGQIVANTFGSVDSVLYFDIADLHGTGDHSTSPMYFNGNDALTLEKLDETIVDLFGKVGEDPDQGWNDDATTGHQAGTEFWKSWTKDHTMVRKSTVLNGVVDNPSVFDTSLEYDSLPKNTFTELGSHECDCNTLGTVEHDAFSFVAYTVNNSIVVSAQEVITKLEVVNLNGQVVSMNQVNGKSFTVNTDLNEGIYIIRLTNNNNVQTSSTLFLK